MGQEFSSWGGGGKQIPKSTKSVQQADPVTHQATTREQWQAAVEPWWRWGPTVEEWLGQATEGAVDMAEVGPGARVLDMVVGAGGQTIAADKRMGPAGTCWRRTYHPTSSSSPSQPHKKKV